MSVKSKKNILQIIPSLHSGGVERGTVDTARELCNHDLGSFVVSSGGAMVSHLNKEGIKHIEINVKTKNPIKIFLNIKKIKNIITKHNINLVHVRSRAPMISAYYACKNNDKVKLISTVHGPYSIQCNKKSSSCKIKKFYNSFMLKGDAIIAVSEFIKKYITDNYQSTFDDDLTKKTQVIARGVDVKKFDPDAVSVLRVIDLVKNWNIPDNKKVILFPARITSWKGHEFLINSLQKVKNDFICVFIGSDHGHEKFASKVKQLIIKNNLQSKVKFLDHQKDMEVAYAVSNIVISASTKPEAFGRVAIESQAMKKITIATNIGGSLETIIDGKTGFLVKNKNTEDFAAKIDRAISLSDKDTQDMGNNARDHVLNNFTNQKMLSSTIALYKKLLS